MPTTSESAAVTIRAATAADDGFILGLVDRFSDFPLPQGRSRAMVDAGVRRDIEHHLRERPADSFMFVLEEDGVRAGFLHLQLVRDFFSGGGNCHVSDVAVARGHEGRGHARALLAFAEDLARAHGCERMTLGVFPGNTRARALYEAGGYVTDLLRMAKPLDPR